MKILIFLILLAASCGKSPSTIESQPFYNPKSGAYLGFAAFAIASENFQEHCTKFLDIALTADKPATAFLFGSFGTNYACLYQFIDEAIALNKPPAVEIHFSSEVLRKKKILHSLDWFPSDSFKQINARLEAMNESTISSIYARIDQIKQVIEPYKDDVFWILSVGLEDQFTLKARTNLTNIIKTVWPYEIAWNPDNGTSAPSGVYMERHHYDKSPGGSNCLLNGDGQDINFAPMGRTGIPFGGKPSASLSKVLDWARQSIAGGCVTLLWEVESQGLTGVNETPTLARQFKIRDTTVTILKDLILNIKEGNS